MSLHGALSMGPLNCLNMSSIRNTSGSPVQATGFDSRQLVQVTNVFACGCKEIQASDASNAMRIRFTEGPCSNFECRNIPMGELLKERGTSELVRAQLMESANQALLAATKQSNKSLSRLSECSPMLWAEAEDVAMGDIQMANAITHAGTRQQGQYLGGYLKVVELVQLMNTFQGLCTVRGLTTHISHVVDLILGSLVDMGKAKDQLLCAVEEVRSAALKAPLAEVQTYGRWQTLKTYVAAFDANYGVQELKLLRSTEAGRQILALPMTRENILAANEYCVARAPSYYAELAAADAPEVCES